MTYDETEESMIDLATAVRECRRHGATLLVQNIDYAGVYDASNGDSWGKVLIVDGQVNARDILDALGY